MKPLVTAEAGEGDALILAGVISAVLVLASLSLAPLAIAFARWIFPGRNVFFARWRFAHVALVALTFVAASLLAGAAWRLFSGVEPGALAQVALTLAVHVAVAALIVRLAQSLDPAGARSLGLWSGRHARAAWVALAGWLVAIPGSIGLVVGWSALLDALGVAHEPQPILDRALELPGAERWLFFALAALVVPFFEELVFRAFLQPLLVQNLGDRGGIVVTSALFAALHGTSAFLPIFGLSLVLGAVMLRTQRLFAAWLVHALHNGATLALVFVRQDARDVFGS